MTLFFSYVHLSESDSMHHIICNPKLQYNPYALLTCRYKVWFFFSKYFIRISQSMHRNFSWFDWKLLFWLYDKWFTDANANFVLLPLNKLYELKLAHIRVISKRPTDRNQKIELSWYSHWNSFIKCNIHLNQRKIAHWPCRCDNKMLTSLLLIR